MSEADVQALIERTITAQTKRSHSPPQWVMWSTSLLIGVMSVAILPWSVWLTSTTLRADPIGTRIKVDKHLTGAQPHAILRQEFLAETKSIRQLLERIEGYH